MFQKLMLIVLLFACAGLFADGVAPLYGDGSQSDPKQIRSYSNLLWLATTPGAWINPNVPYFIYYIQTTDIDASPSMYLPDGGMPTIGRYFAYNDIQPFVGQYDGQGFTISNLYIHRPSNWCQGLFGYTGYTGISGLNTRISNLNIRDASVTGSAYTGILVGESHYLQVINCSVDGGVFAATDAAGLIGRAYNSTIEACYNLAEVNSAEVGGGIVGEAYDSDIIDCYNRGQIGSEGSWSMANGGIVGALGGTCNIENCYSAATIYGDFVIGAILGSIGSPSINVEACFWDTEIETIATAGAGEGPQDHLVGLTTAEMKLSSSYTDDGDVWDFVNTWEIRTTQNNGYPILRWQPVEVPIPTATAGDVFISEVSDNYLGGPETTGFVELYNIRATSVSIGGFELRSGTVAGSFIQLESYTIPEGTTMEPSSFLLIGNGAIADDFEDTWALDDPFEYLPGDAALNIASGFAYQLWDPVSRTDEIDVSPVVPENQAVVQETVGNWTPPGPSDDSTPGEYGVEEPLPVTLSAFTAVQTSNNLAQINWTTISESSLIGFNIYRNDFAILSSSILLNVDIVPPTNTTTMQSYSFEDDNVDVNHSYYYWLESIGADCNSELFGPAFVNIEYQEENPGIIEIPLVTNLRSAYPNPFNPTTVIDFDIEENESAKLLIYNAKGQKLVSKEFSSGSHSYIWNANDCSTGVYFYKLQSANYTKVNKMILMK